MKLFTLGASIFAGSLLMSSLSFAQDSVAIEPQVLEGTIDLGTGGVADMGPEIWETWNGLTQLRNVSDASLTPVLPDPSKATGAAILVMPGGGFRTLAIQSEGMDVAEWLADQGIAAFVLKYRLRPTPTGPYNSQIAMEGLTDIDSMIAQLETPPQSLEDAQAALQLVQDRAAEWNIDTDRLGIMGFSAGAILSLSLTLSDEEHPPAFVAAMYPLLDSVEVPADAPPLFVGVAVDDPLFGNRGYGLIESWSAAGRPVELHAYQKGSHAFGLGVPGTTTTDWTASFLHWLSMNEFLTAK